MKRKDWAMAVLFAFFGASLSRFIEWVLNFPSAFWWVGYVFAVIWTMFPGLLYAYEMISNMTEEEYK